MTYNLGIDSFETRSGYASKFTAANTQNISKNINETQAL